MALEAVVYQQDQLFTHSARDFYSLLGGNTWETSSLFDFPLLENVHDVDSISFDNFLINQTENSFHHSHASPPNSSMYPPPHHFAQMLQNNPSPDHAYSNNANGLTTNSPSDLPENHLDSSSTVPVRAKRRRSRSRKNKEEIENQRMTHIAVERNRRKQMNEYLSVLRSLMPESYVQRGDQASIIGGAINFVKELEQRLQSVGGKKEVTEKCDGADHHHHQQQQQQLHASTNSLPFSEFFSFPQYSTSPARSENSVAGGNDSISSVTQSTIADIEVTMVESHASLKIRSKRRPKQLLKVVSGLHALRLTILHLNVTTVEQIVLYSLSVKVEDDCKLSSVDEIATAVYQMLGRIQEEYCMMN
ncbi:transcription factor bHLH96 [Euphorbia lathyris]|uniref:transcription factor bHLH96 n=1 Tax=Euphorbia lathyris TaxID=212925 RepID=UPI003313C44F